VQYGFKPIGCKKPTATSVDEHAHRIRGNLSLYGKKKEWGTGVSVCGIAVASLAEVSTLARLKIVDGAIVRTRIKSKVWHMRRN
jgi:hypothetical protein